MGLSNANAALAMMAMRNALRRDSVATLGKQVFWPSPEFLKAAISAADSELTPEGVFSAVGARRDGSMFFRLLGANRVDEIDASDYEGASIVHDLNQPVPALHRQQYDVVFDGGTSEHIFDVRQVLQNAGDLLKTGGLFVGSTCGNNLLGHGFYQFSPEFFYRYFTVENGWKHTCVFLCEHQRAHPRFWYVEDPMLRQHRINIQNRTQLYCMVVSERSFHPERLTVPQQSDYVSTWSGRTEQNDTSIAGTRKRSVSFGRNLLRRARAAVRRRLQSGHLNGAGLGQPGIHRLTINDFVNYSIRG